VLLHVHDDGHAAYLRLVGDADSQAVDVETPAREEAGHASQHAGLVLHHHGKGVLHG